MKITSIRVKGQLPSTDLILEIERTLRRRFARAGFITQVAAQTRSCIKIGLHMRSFKLDLTKHDRNLRHNPHLGAKLTDTPTWQQRVEFNNIVNSVLNKFRVSANVKSGPFTIRAGRQVFTESDWFDQKPGYLRHNESHGYYIEECDEHEFLEERRIERNRLARERRAAAKTQPVLQLVGGV
jgi:hypothetical protein